MGDPALGLGGRSVLKSDVDAFGPVVASFRPGVSSLLGLDRERARRVLTIGVQIALLLVVLTRLVTSSWALPMALLLIAILGAALVGWIWLYLANSTIALTASHLLITDWRDSTTVIARSDVTRLIRVGVKPFEGPPRQAVIGVNAAGRSLFTLDGAYDAAAIAGSLSVPLRGSYDDVLMAAQVALALEGLSRMASGSAKQRTALREIGGSSPQRPIRVNFGLPSGVIGVWTRRLVAEHAP